MLDFNTLNIGKRKLTHVNYVCYLGILLDNQLNWKFHISYLAIVLKVINAFKLIKRLVPLLWNGGVWYFFTNLPTENSGNSKQNPQTYNKDWYTPTNILHKELRLLPIQDIFSLFQLTFAHYQQQGKLPETYSLYYVTEKISIAEQLEIGNRFI